MSTLRAGDREFHTLPAGQVLTAVAAAASEGVVRQYPMSGFDAVSATAVSAGVTATIGPFTGSVRLGVECSAGTVDWSAAVPAPASDWSDGQTAAGQALVSTPGNTAALRALANDPQGLPNPQLVDSYQAHGLYTLTGSVGTASTGAAQNAAGSKVIIPSDGSGTTIMTSTRAAPLSLCPSKTGVWVWGANVSGLCAGTWLTLQGNNLPFSDSATLPLYAQGLRFHAVHASEAAAFFALGASPQAVSPKLSYQMTAVTGAVTWQPGPIWCNAAGLTTFVMIFDDVSEDIYTTAFPIMEALGLKGTVMVPSTLVGTAGKMTVAQLQALQAAGWAICSNITADDSSALVADATGATNALNVVRQYLVDNGLSRNQSESFGCWPNDARSELLYTAFRAAGMKVIRGSTGRTVYDRFGIGAMNMACPSYSMSASTTGATLTAQMDLAVLRGSTQLFHTHRVMETGATGVNVSATDFRVAMQYMAALIAAGTARNLTLPDWHQAVRNNAPPPVYA